MVIVGIDRETGRMEVGVRSRTRRRTGPLPAGSEAVVGARKQAIRRAILRSSSASLSTSTRQSPERASLTEVSAMAVEKRWSGSEGLAQVSIVREIFA